MSMMSLGLFFCIHLPSLCSPPPLACPSLPVHVGASIMAILFVVVVAMAVPWHWWSSVVIIHPCCVPGCHFSHGGGNYIYKTIVSYERNKIKRI